MYYLLKVSVVSLLVSFSFGLPEKHSVEFYISSQNVVRSDHQEVAGTFTAFKPVVGCTLYWPPYRPAYTFYDCHNSSVQSGPDPSWDAEVLVASRDDMLSSYSFLGPVAWFNVYDLQIYEQMDDGTVNKIAGHFRSTNTGIHFGDNGEKACTSGAPVDVKLQTATSSVNFIIQVHCVSGPFPLTTTTTIRPPNAV